MNLFWIIFLVAIVLISFLREVKQYERGVVLTMGRYTSLRKPGWSIIVPVFQKMYKVDLRVKAVDVPDQKVITKDNVSASINAVIYYRVSDAAMAILEVEDFRYAVSQLAQTTMRNVVGGAELDEVLSQREKLSTQIQNIVDEETNQWGIKVDNVELKDFFLPEDMERTIAKQAEAERERRSVIIKAEGEVVAAENIQKAARILSSAPGALHLRTLQTLNDLSSDQSNTVVFATPIEVLRAFEGTKEWLQASVAEKTKDN
ncbi:MAG: SPFH domain-containing protein [Candidatus Nomurabacteria bacterium]|nr:SPFH domain-containing protein [Candidatus Nomurabacteria bacterium]USN87689.1 MAG: SPFH domain-containing protein [Candidatus Nomurabacteria bacterium]